MNSTNFLMKRLKALKALSCIKRGFFVTGLFLIKKIKFANIGNYVIVGSIYRLKLLPTFFN